MPGSGTPQALNNRISPARQEPGAAADLGRLWTLPGKHNFQPSKGKVMQASSKSNLQVFSALGKLSSVRKRLCRDAGSSVLLHSPLHPSCIHGVLLSATCTFSSFGLRTICIASYNTKMRQFEQ